mgnify:CR=1 FL=1
MLFTKRCALQQTHGMDNHGDPCLRQALKPQNKSCFASLPDRIPSHTPLSLVLKQRTQMLQTVVYPVFSSSYFLCTG